MPTRNGLTSVLMYSVPHHCHLSIAAERRAVGVRDCVSASTGYDRNYCEGESRDTSMGDGTRMFGTGECGSMTWFESLFGFDEQSPLVVRSKLRVEGTQIIASENGRRFEAGRLTTPSLHDLSRQAALSTCHGSTEVFEVVADSKLLHADCANEGALFQVASQFNLLEMVSPSVTPEAGISRYANDLTQGPACAMSCAAGTVFRNYFACVGNQVGQTATRQIDCLADVGTALGNTDDSLWQMKNGYALASEAGLKAIAAAIANSDPDQLAELRGHLRIGLQSQTEVTLENCGHRVSQAYCSALPVAYSHLPDSEWEPFARLILDAAYEATLAAGVLNRDATGNNGVFLTLLGGGAFGNRMSWIISAIERALTLYEDAGLNVAIVSYRASNPLVVDLIARLAKR